MAFRLLLVLMLLGSNRFVLSQTLYALSGTLQDSSSRQPLVRATVVIDFEKPGKGTCTDNAGQFSLALPAGGHVVVVRHVGYLPFPTRLYLRENIRPYHEVPSVSSQWEQVVIPNKSYDRTGRVHNAKLS